MLVIPYALVFGGSRGIPFWWRLIDCSFGVLGFIPLWFCRQWTSELEQCVKSQRRIKSIVGPYLYKLLALFAWRRHIVREFMLIIWLRILR